MTTNAILVSDVSYAPGGTPILDAVTFRATENRIGIVGRNGSGKTTLARVMAGLIEPSAGRVTIAGVDVAKDRKSAVATVGILFQNPDHQIIFPTVEEEIGFGLLQSGQTRSAARDNTHDILARFGKEHWAKAAIHQMSQGQKQLVCLMSILVMKPEVILLDEPFSGLDIPTRLQLGRYLAQIETALVHISHDPASLAGYQRVIWLDRGKIVQDGAAQPTLAAFARRMAEIGGGDDISDLAG